MTFLADEQLPNFNFDDLHFDHDYNLTRDRSPNLSPPRAQVDLHGQAIMPEQQPAHFDSMNEEWYHLQQQGLGHMQLTPGSVPVDPLLFD